MSLTQLIHNIRKCYTNALNYLGGMRNFLENLQDVGDVN